MNEPRRYVVGEFTSMPRDMRAIDVRTAPKPGNFSWATEIICALVFASYVTVLMVLATLFTWAVVAR